MMGRGGEGRGRGWNEDEEVAFVLTLAREEKGICMVEVGRIS